MAWLTKLHCISIDHVSKAYRIMGTEVNNSITLEIDYQTISINMYDSLSRLPGFVLLQSTDTYYGRYDILSAYPYDRVVISPADSDPMALLRLIESKLVIQPSQSDLPFQGGAIGYVAYDLNQVLFDVKSVPKDALKDMPLLNFGFYDWALIVDHHLKEAFLYSANTQTSTPDTIEEIQRLIRSSTYMTKEVQVQRRFIPVMSKSDYKQGFNNIHRALKQGRAYQVNFTQGFHSKYEGDSWLIYKDICRRNPVPYASFIRTEEADILSFSPERFIYGNAGKLIASPIKGTIHRSDNPEEDNELREKLFNSDKNRAENVMIVDLLRNDLGKIAKPGSVSVPNLFAVQSFNGVHHLVSDIHAETLDEIHPFQAFLSCFPGGSITGAPKLESMKIISEEETCSRGIYCGSIGYFSKHGRFDMNIAIRTITAKDNTLHLGAGGGLVIDSTCEEEYLECYTKISAIMNAINTINF